MLLFDKKTLNCIDYVLYTIYIMYYGVMRGKL